MDNLFRYFCTCDSHYTRACVPANRRVYQKRVRRKRVNSCGFFFSYTSWKALICSPQSQNGGESQQDCARNSEGLRSFYRGHGWDIEAPNDTEVKPRILKRGEKESSYNESPARVLSSKWRILWNPGYACLTSRWIRTAPRILEIQVTLVWKCQKKQWDHKREAVVWMVHL